MRATNNAAAWFAADQDWQFRVRLWDTPYTVLENDVASSGMALYVYEPKSVTTDWAAYVAAVKAVGPSANPTDELADAAYVATLVNNGRWPVVQTYWGAGTPSWWGGTVPGKVALRFSGTLVPTAQRAWFSGSSTVTFAVAGSGWCRIDIVDGATRTQVFESDLTEGEFLSSGFLQSAAVAVPAGATIDVLYIQTGTEPWGGLVVKAIPSGGTAAEAPVLSAGLFSASDVAPVTLAFVKDIQISQDSGAASRAEIQFPLINPNDHDGHGWEFVRPAGSDDPGALQLWDGGTAGTTLKRFRLVQIEVARPEATPTWIPLFTGHTVDFSTNDPTTVSVTCAGFEGRLVEHYEQVPDRISYMSRGLRTLNYGEASNLQFLEPVYNVPAFDNWPLAWAVEEMAVRAGLDPSRFRKTALSVAQDGTGTAIELPWGPAYQFRGETTSGTKVRLPRPAHYGNVGYAFTENRPIDDEYMFPVEPTTDSWAAIRKLTDRLGYVCRFAADGTAVLYPANTPSFVEDLRAADVVSGTVTEQLSASAYGATYLEATTPASVVEKIVTGARIDVAFPRISTALTWTVQVYLVAGNVLQTTLVVDPADNSLNVLEHMFASRTSTAGTSATLGTVFSGPYAEYRVRFTSENTAGSAYLDALIVYAQDPDLSVVPTLTTDDVAEGVQVRGQQDATRNRVTIVGRRKGVVTDSDKFAEAKAPTEQEFVTQSAVDVASITDPTAANYVGYVKQSVIYDESITDDAFARYLAEVFIYRQRIPQPGTAVTHTLLPMLELGDPVMVEEATFDTVQATKIQYVRSLQHRITRGNLETTLETEPWAPYPAYETRTDIDLALFNNQPAVINEISYVSLSGHDVVDPTGADVFQVYEQDVKISYEDVAVTTNGLGTFLALPSDAPWPPVDGTVQIAVRDIGAEDTLSTQFTLSNSLVGSPFSMVGRVFDFDISPDWRIMSVTVSWSVQAWDSNTQSYIFVGVAGANLALGSGSGSNYYQTSERRLSIYVGDVPFQPSATAPYMLSASVVYQMAGADLRNDWITNNPYHRFVTIDHDATAATETAATAARIKLDWRQGTGTGVYARDPAVTSYDVRYRAQLPSGGVDPNGLVSGEPFSPFYDPYTSELGYLVSVKADVLAEGLYRISLRNRQTNDTVAWFTNPGAPAKDDEQHWEYISTAQTLQFNWDGVDQVGLWNAQQSELYERLVGGTFGDEDPIRVGAGYYAWNREVSSGASLGPMAYVWMKEDANGRPYIGQGTFAEWYVHIESRTAAAGDVVIKSDTSIFTHLTEPTRLELKVEDWDLGTSQYVNPTLNVGTTTLGAWIRDGDGGANPAKPIRIRFKAMPRPGALWTGAEGEVNVKLTREVHLRVLIGDQCVVWKGGNFAGLAVEDRTIYNRRLVNDEHTLRYADSGFRKAKFLKWTDSDEYGVTEWVFQPSDFQKDFRLSGLRESIRFGDYLQLEEVPEWNGTRDVGTARSRLQFAVMSYLFYFSAFVTDRSGRSSWGLNRFLQNGTTPVIDKSKQLTTTDGVTWPDDPMYQHRRSIICRQWTNEPSWELAQRTAFNYAAGSLFDKLLKHWWWQHDITETTIGVSSPANWSSFSLTIDGYSDSHVSISAHDLPALYATEHRQLGTVTGVSSGLATIDQKLGSGGTWTFENGPAWVPSITRDLHPFYFVPPMWVPPAGGSLQGGSATQRTQNTYTSVAGPNTSVVAPNGTTIKVEDIAAATTWTAWTRDMTSHPLSASNRFYPGYQVEREYFRSENITAQPNMINYVRQDETIHYEELRGTYTRGSYPAGPPVKLNAAGPYYINHHRYFGVDVRNNLRAPGFPIFHTVENPLETRAGLKIDWFRTAFRSHYVWESGSMFPVDSRGRERLPMTLWWRTRFYGSNVATQLLYDYGAWTGWKDDMQGSTALVVKKDGEDCSAFTTDAMPVGVSSVLPETVELTAHLVLVPSRRGDL
jgi:hypothetical protein